MSEKILLWKVIGGQHDTMQYRWVFTDGESSLDGMYSTREESTDKLQKTADDNINEGTKGKIEKQDERNIV